MAFNAEVSDRRAAVELASREVERQQLLFSKAVGAERDFDRAKTELTRAQAALSSSEERLALTREVFRRWQTEQARSEFDRARTQLRQSEVIARASENPRAVGCHRAASHAWAVPSAARTSRASSSLVPDRPRTSNTAPNSDTSSTDGAEQCDRLSFILQGKILPFVLIGYVQLTVLVLLMGVLFNVHIRGSVAALYLVTGIYIAAVLGPGMWLSTIAQTQTQATQLTVMIALRFVFLSGYAFPIEGMPTIFQWMTQAVPANYSIQVIRGIVLRSATLAELREPIAWLTMYTVLIICMAVMPFKKTAA